MTELFDELSIVGDPVSEEDRVVHLLASLPESYSMLVTAIEANADIPKIEIVTERLLHEERKQKGCAESADTNSMEKVMTSEQRIRREGVRCHYCKRTGHFKCDCF